MGFNPFEIFQDFSFLKNLQTTGYKEDDPNDKTEELMNEDVQNEDDLDDWTIDDFFVAIPKTIDDGLYDTICEFHFWYSKERDCWIAAYKTPWGDYKLETENIDKYECLKNLYFKLKTL